MRNLYKFLIRNYFFFQFVLLEVIAFLLLFRNNHYHSTRFYNYSSEISNSIVLVYDNIAEYFSLRSANRQLVNENARLRGQLNNAYYKTDKNVFLRNDTFYRIQYSYVAAKVINNSINKRNNYITINKGSFDGLTQDMAVVSPNGIVGIVKDVSFNFSSVISVLHKDTRISAKIKKNGHVGSLVWEGVDYRQGTLKDVPTHVKLAKGDTIITSGYSDIFPEGVIIGFINSYKVIQGENFYTINVQFSTDFNNLSYVYVIRNMMKDEQSHLEKTSQHE